VRGRRRISRPGLGKQSATGTRVVGKSNELAQREHADRVVEVELGPRHVLRVRADVFPAVQIGEGEHR
jgi:hypothetical protein